MDITFHDSKHSNVSETVQFIFYNFYNLIKITKEFHSFTLSLTDYLVFTYLLSIIEKPSLI